MEQDELLRRVVETLESLDLPYLIAGSIATILYGETRFTNDIDHPASGLRIDVMIPAMDAFDRSRFSGATRVHPADDYEATFASARSWLNLQSHYDLEVQRHHLGPRLAKEVAVLQGSAA